MRTTSIAPTGLLMGGDRAKTGHLGVSAETRQSEKEALFSSARGRNRTADTGIFNPRGMAANIGESSDSAHTRAANGRFRSRARRWLTRPPLSAGSPGSADNSPVPA